MIKIKFIEQRLKVNCIVNLQIRYVYCVALVKIAIYNALRTKLHIGILDKEHAEYDIFRFDELLMVNKERYSEFVMKEIDDMYGKMLKCGAMSFWETEKTLKILMGKKSLSWLDWVADLLL